MSQGPRSQATSPGQKPRKFVPSPELSRRIDRLADRLKMSRRRTRALLESHVAIGEINRAHRALEKEFDAWLPPKLRSFKKAMLGGLEKFLRKQKAKNRLKVKKSA